MELRRILAPTAAALFPSPLKQRFYGDLWQKDQLDVVVTDHEDAFTLYCSPLPYVKLLFEFTNRLPVKVQIYGASVEIWLGKPVVQSYSALSETVQPGDTVKALYAYTFLNNYQQELLNPSKKNTLPPNCTINLTVSCRSSLGMVEKTIKKSWIPPKIRP